MSVSPLILHDSFSREFSPFVFPRTLCFSVLLFYHPSHPHCFLLCLSFDFIVVCVICSLPFFPLVRLWSLLSFSFVSLLFLPPLFYLECRPSSFFGLACLVFLPTLIFLSSSSFSRDHWWLPASSSSIIPVRKPPKRMEVHFCLFTFSYSLSALLVTWFVVFFV